MHQTNQTFILCFHIRYHWIKRRGRPASRGLAPIVVSNHVSYIEPIFFFYELFPTIVASVSHDSIPLVGTIIRSMQVSDFLSFLYGFLYLYSALTATFFFEMRIANLISMFQVIYVDRFSASSRKHAVNEIKVLIFVLILATHHSIDLIVQIYACDSYLCLC